MAEVTKNASEERFSTRRGTEIEATPEPGLESWRKQAGHAVTLLRDPKLNRKANTAIRSQTAQEAQRTYGNRSVQRYVQHSPASKPLPVQREDEDDEFRFRAIPPELHIPMGPAALDADTSRAQLGYRNGPLNLGLGYQYGGDIYASGQYGGLSGRLGFNPGDERFSLSGRYGDFSGSAYAGLNGAAGLSLSYGDALLPMPGDLSRSIYGGEAGMRNLISGMPGILDDPIAGIGRHSGDISALGSAGSNLADVAGADRFRFGAGLQLGYDPTGGVTVMGGVQGRF